MSSKMIENEDSLEEYTVVVSDENYGVNYYYLKADKNLPFADAVTEYNKVCSNCDRINISRIVFVFIGRCLEVNSGWWYDSQS